MADLKLNTKWYYLKELPHLFFYQNLGEASRRK